MFSRGDAGQPPATDPPAQRGFVLPLYAHERDFDYQQFLLEIAATGANSVELLFPLFIADAAATEVRPDPRRTPSDAALIRAILGAQSAGLEVSLFPIVLLDEESRDEWRGALAPADVGAWFESYGDSLAKYAEMATSHGVARLSIGSELTSLEQHEAHWRRLASQVRSHFGGRISYTCNWDSPETVQWWEAVDEIGVSGYYELADDGAATTATLTREWEEWREWLLASIHESGAGLPIVFSEIGYPSRDGGTAFPWDYTRDAPIDLEEQRRGIEAFIRAWNGHHRLGGVYFYAWHDFSEDPARGYSLRRKPAAELISGWYGAL